LDSADSNRWYSIGTSAVSPDNRLHGLAFNELAIISDRHKGAEVATLTGHTETVRCVSFSPDGRLFVTAGDDETIRVWALTPS
jgi:WD40 repeat protein